MWNIISAAESTAPFSVYDFVVEEGVTLLVGAFVSTHGINGNTINSMRAPPPSPSPSPVLPLNPPRRRRRHRRFLRHVLLSSSPMDLFKAIAKDPAPIPDGVSDKMGVTDTPCFFFVWGAPNRLGSSLRYKYISMQGERGITEVGHQLNLGLSERLAEQATNISMICTIPLGVHGENTPYIYSTLTKRGNCCIATHPAPFSIVARGDRR